MCIKSFGYYQIATELEEIISKRRLRLNAIIVEQKTWSEILCAKRFHVD